MSPREPDGQNPILKKQLSKKVETTSLEKVRKNTDDRVRTDENVLLVQRRDPLLLHIGQGAKVQKQSIPGLDYPTLCIAEDVPTNVVKSLWPYASIQEDKIELTALQSTFGFSTTRILSTDSKLASAIGAHAQEEPFSTIQRRLDAFCKRYGDLAKAAIWVYWKFVHFRVFDTLNEKFSSGYYNFPFQRACFLLGEDVFEDKHFELLCVYEMVESWVNDESNSRGLSLEDIRLAHSVAPQLDDFLHLYDQKMSAVFNVDPNNEHARVLYDSMYIAHRMSWRRVLQRQHSWLVKYGQRKYKRVDEMDKAPAATAVESNPTGKGDPNAKSSLSAGTTYANKPDHATDTAVHNRSRASGGLKNVTAETMETPRTAADELPERKNIDDDNADNAHACSCSQPASGQTDQDSASGGAPRGRTCERQQRVSNPVTTPTVEPEETSAAMSIGDRAPHKKRTFESSTDAVGSDIRPLVRKTRTCCRQRKSPMPSWLPGLVQDPEKRRDLAPFFMMPDGETLAGAQDDGVIPADTAKGPLPRWMRTYVLDPRKRFADVDRSSIVRDLSPFFVMPSLLREFLG